MIANGTPGNTHTLTTSPSRPAPPSGCGELDPPSFHVDHAFLAWIRETFLSDASPLGNPEHAHLNNATIGVVWTNIENVSKQRGILATAEMPQIQAGGWKRGRFEHQMRQWFGDIPEFVLTFYAPGCAQLTDRQFCALVEHELYHCAQALDAFGNPKFSLTTGLPLFAIRGHDVEEFTGVVARYGAVSSDLRAFLDAANAAPAVGDESIVVACGTCRS